MIEHHEPQELNGLKSLASQYGRTPLLVQGAGGNVSFKDSQNLWIKASGHWMANALTQDIFVPIDLALVRRPLLSSDFSSVTNHFTGKRPSIETQLHAIFPEKFVVHLHPVEAVSVLIQPQSASLLERAIGNQFRWKLLPYAKPGPDLAQSLASIREAHPDTQVFLLQNHGIVVAGNDLETIASTIEVFLKLLDRKPLIYRPDLSKMETNGNHGDFKACQDNELNMLATNSILLTRVKNDWAISPDHVVFLGDSATICNGGNEDWSAYQNTPFVFVPGVGVFEHKSVTPGQQLQLRAYFDTVIRLSESEQICCLSWDEIANVLNWDAEKYRQSLRL